ERTIYQQAKKNEDDNVSCLNQKFNEGKIEGKIEVAKNLLKAGVSVNLVAESTGLPKDEIEQLKKK
ncbi:MAG: transposase, partial [Wolbachia sp.]